MTGKPAKPPIVPRRLRRTARGVALEALAPRTGYVQDRLHQLFEEFGVYHRDRALATELAMGCVRHERLIDRLIDHFVRKPHDRARLPRPIRTLLGLGIFQLLWMQRIPPHAAVAETVELAKSIQKGRFVGMVNAVLRKLQRSVVDRCLPAGPDNPPTSRRLWLDHARMCELDFDFLPDPAADPIEYWAWATSHDPFLLRRWHARGLPFDRIALAGISTPTICLRPNLLRTDVPTLTAQLRRQGCRVAVAGDGLGVYLLSGPALLQLEAFAQGLCQPQDLTAINVVARWLAPRPGWRVLDLCAAPGTKTTHIAELMGDCGTVVATDVNPVGLQRLEANRARLGIHTVRTVSRHELPRVIDESGAFDAVLVDAPCSNTGVLARRPEAKRVGRLTKRRLAELQAAQVDLLGEALAYVRVGGRVIYTTCSLEIEENERVVERVLSDQDSVSLQGQCLTLPNPDVTNWNDGGYVACLRRTAPCRPRSRLALGDLRPKL